MTNDCRGCKWGINGAPDYSATICRQCLGDAAKGKGQGVTDRHALTPVSERRFLDRVRILAQDAGWLFYHTHDSRRSDPGFPDCVLVRGVEIIFAELKSAHGRVSEAQQEWIDALGNAGMDVYLWRPADMAEIEEVLK